MQRLLRRENDGYGSGGDSDIVAGGVVMLANDGR